MGMGSFCTKRIFLLVSLCAAPIMGCSLGNEEKSAETLYDSGLNALDEKRTQDARFYFNKVIQKDSGHAMAHYQLGRMYIKSKQIHRAKREFSLAIRHDPDLIKAKRFLARLYYQNGAYEKALPLYRELVKLQGEPPETLIILSQLLLSLGYVREARNLMEDAAATHPGNIGIRIALAGVYEKAGYYTLAEKTLKHLRQDFSDNTEPYVALARFHMRQGHLAPGKAIVKQALEKGLGNLDLHQTLFEIEHRRKDHQAALRHLKRAVALWPDDPKRLLLLGDYFLFLKMYDRARRTYHQIARNRPESTRVKNRLVKLLIAQGRYSEALEHIEALIADAPQNAEAHLHRGIIRLRQGKTDQAREAFLKARTLEPESVEGYYFYGLTLLKEQKYELSLSEILRAVDRRPRSIRARMVLAYVYFKTDQLQLALQELGGILIAQPHHRQARVLRATVYLRLKNYEAATSEYRYIIETERSSPEIRLRLAETYRLQGRLDDAAVEFQHVLNNHPDSLRVFKKVVFIYLAKKQYAKAMDLCNAYVDKHPEALEVILIKARILREQGRYDVAENILEDLSDRFPESDQPVLLLAEILKTGRKYRSALANYQKAVNRNPKQIKARMKMAEIYELQGDFHKAIDAYKAVLHIHGSYAPAINNLAYLYATTHQDLDHALVLARRAHELMPDSPHVKDTLGWAYLKKGALFLAKKYLDEAVQEMPLAPLFRYHLGLAFYQAEDLPEAREAFAKAIQSGLEGKESAHARNLLQQLRTESRS
ncbi:MAG: tetratricopeptide repeat protein [Desulfatiglandaceae bacterium]